MKKPLKAILVVFIFLIIFLTSLWYFFPWQNAGVFAVSGMSQQLGRRGIASGWGEVTSEGNFIPVITVNDFVIRNFAGGMSFPFIRVRPIFSDSLLQGGAVFKVEFPDTSLKFSMGDMEDMTVAGSTAVTITENGLKIQDLLLNGDVEASGDISVNTSAGKITEARMTIKVPEKTETLLYSLNSFLPLKRNSPGEWELVRTGGN